MKVLESHMVGGTRFIEPVGTEMTQWGTRIIKRAGGIPAGLCGRSGRAGCAALHAVFAGQAV